MSGIKISASAPPQAGRKFSYQVAVDAGQGVTSVVLARVYRPDGSLAREYSENLETREGVASSGFHPALSDPKGAWKVVATEAVSGQTATLEFQLP